MFVNRIISVIALCVSITAFTFLAMVGSSFDYYSYIDDYFAMILITALQTVYVMKDKTNIFKSNRKNYLIFSVRFGLLECCGAPVDNKSHHI